MFFPLLCAALLAVAYAPDTPCTSRGGHCQYTSATCSGHYEAGFCEGPADRQCCLAGAVGSCPAEVKALACQLASSANVIAAKAHPSGRTDNAYAYNNLHDVCNGRMAARSHYTCSTCSSPGAPGGYTCLSPNLLKYMLELKSHGSIHVNEIAGACHSCNSRHYSGLAVDLHGYDAVDGRDRRQEMLSTCTRMGGWGQDEGNHIHCQFYDGPHPNWK